MDEIAHEVRLRIYKFDKIKIPTLPPHIDLFVLFCYNERWRGKKP